MAEKKTAGTKRPAARRMTLTKRRVFLRWLSQTANVARAAREAGIDRSMAYRLRQESDSFRTSWDEAMNEALDTLEAALFERAALGVERPVFYGGKHCGTVTQYSDALGMFILRARRPHIFGKTASDGDDDVSPLSAQSAARQEVLEKIGRMADRFSDSDRIEKPLA